MKRTRDHVHRTEGILGRYDLPDSHKLSDQVRRETVVTALNALFFHRVSNHRLKMFPMDKLGCA